MKCNNDSACGSIYTSPTCYFFLEPQYHVEAINDIQYIGKWEGGGLVSINYDSNVYFFDKNNVRFQLSGADGPVGVKVLYNLNLSTGEVSTISNKFLKN